MFLDLTKPLLERYGEENYVKNFMPSSDGPLAAFYDVKQYDFLPACNPRQRVDARPRKVASLKGFKHITKEIDMI